MTALLGEGYDPEVYWAGAGATYESTYDPVPYGPANKVIAGLLEPLAWQDAMDVGCGFGRLGEVLQRIRPGSSYAGFDISPDQIAAARRRLGPDAFLSVASISEAVTWKTENVYDLVVTAECLMHQPDVSEIVEAMFRWVKPGGHVLSFDWYEPGMAHTSNAWNVMHDYPALYGDRLVASGLLPDRHGVFLARKDCG